MSDFLDLIKAHERFTRGKVGGCRAFFRFEQLRGAVLQGRKLDSIEFIGCDLSEAQLAVASLRSASFYCTSLQGADLRGADLTAADMRGALLRGASLYRAVLDNADFRKAVLIKDERDKTLEYPDFDDTINYDEEERSVDFRDCSLKDARLNNAKFKEAEFSGAILDGANLNGADLRGASFDNAILTNIAMDNAMLDGASMRDVVRDSSEDAAARVPELRQRLHDAVKYTRTAGKEGARGNFDGEDLRLMKKDFVNSGLAGASLRGVNAIGVDFSRAILVGAVFDGSDLRGAHFEGADLRGCSFRDCKLGQAVFNSANLQSFVGREGRVFPPRFDGAALGSVRIQGAVTDENSSLGEDLRNAAMAA